jgi:hypothetical protein
MKCYRSNSKKFSSESLIFHIIACLEAPYFAWPAPIESS